MATILATVVHTNQQFPPFHQQQHQHQQLFHQQQQQQSMMGRGSKAEQSGGGGGDAKTPGRRDRGGDAKTPDRRDRGDGKGGEEREKEVHWRSKGRPAGSKNKPKPPIIITRDNFIGRMKESFIGRIWPLRKSSSTEGQVSGTGESNRAENSGLYEAAEEATKATVVRVPAAERDRARGGADMGKAEEREIMGSQNETLNKRGEITQRLAWTLFFFLYWGLKDEICTVKYFWVEERESRETSGLRREKGDNYGFLG